MKKEMFEKIEFILIILKKSAFNKPGLYFKSIALPSIKIKER